MPKYYPINEEAAKRAKDMNSFSDYQPGSATAGYRAMVDEAYAAAERQKARVDPMYHDKIDALVDRYTNPLGFRSLWCPGLMKELSRLDCQQLIHKPLYSRSGSSRNT